MPDPTYDSDPSDRTRSHDPDALAGDVTHAGEPRVARADFGAWFGPPTEEGDLGTLGPYRIQAHLGMGGMSAVYRAHDTRSGRPVALKLLRATATANARDRFLYEARAIARLEHDHVVRMYDAGEHGDVPFIAMELLVGRTLDDLIRSSGRLAVRTVLRVAREVASGLAAAHRLGMVHRDIKPTNIWLQAPDDRVKLLDFGLAVRIDDEWDENGGLVGTPRFMSPEQARSERVDGRSDLFSLGCVLYRLCTGNYPFDGANLTAVLEAVVTTDPAPVRDLNPDIPEPVAELVHWLLEKCLDARPQSANEVVGRVDTILAELPPDPGTPDEVSLAAATQLLAACRAAGLAADPDEIADAVWLARWMPGRVPAAPAAPEVDAPVLPVPETPSQPEEPPAEAEKPVEPVADAPPTESPALADAPTEPTTDDIVEGTGNLHLPAGPGRGGRAGGASVRAPAAPALPRALDIARALRPLARRVPSRVRFVLDANETVRRFAEEGVCAPTLRPARERWLRVTLVIDTRGGADLWSETVRDFRALLTGLGTFRHVRTWHLDTAASPPWLTPATGSGAPRDPGELIDATGRTLTVVLSTCVADGWYDGSVASLLGRWAERGPVVLVPLLPEEMWSRTGLADAELVWLAAPTAGVANASLKAAAFGGGDELPVGVKLPVAPLEPEALREWASVVAAAPGAETPGFVLGAGGAVRDRGGALSAADRVDRFRGEASPEGQRLAGMVAASPVVSLPVLRLIRRAMLPEAGQPQEAEVLFGGLLERAVEDGPDPRFEFVPGVREKLLDGAPTDESLEVLAAVSEYVGERLSSQRTFRAVLADPTSAVGEVVEDTPFARVAAAVLLRAGGDYARMVRRGGRKPASVPGVRPAEPGVPAPEPAAAEPVAPPPAVEPPVERVLSADLEALTRIESSARGSQSNQVSTQLGQYSWRYQLPLNKVLRLGSDASYCDWTVPEDRMISRFHATLEWNGQVLTVARRGALLPDFPSPPQNQIWFQNKPVESCAVRPGEWFVIGQTRFTVRGGDEQEPDAPVDATIVQRQEERSREELGDVELANPAVLLKAMERLPSFMRTVVDEAGLFRQMLRFALEALPRVDAATVVRVPPDAPANDLRVTVLAQNVRNPNAGAASEYMPSRKLVRRAVVERQASCLHVWSPDAFAGTEHEMNLTLAAAPEFGFTPWAVCTPFRDGSQLGLYVSGRLTARASDASPDQSHLTEYQKFTEFLVGLMESTRRMLRLTRQAWVTQQAWPTGILRYLDDPGKLEAMLAPQEKDVAVLFCDFRGYAQHADARGDLTTAWGAVQAVLDAVESAVAERGGVTVGLRSDAVLGVWGWPTETPDRHERAAAAGTRIREQLSDYVARGGCAIGLAEGRALVGRLDPHGAGVGAHGPPLEAARHLAEVARAFGVGAVVTAEVARKLRTTDPGGERLRLRSLGRVGRKNGAQVVYELAPMSVLLRFAAEWEQAVAFFTAGRWFRARQSFDEMFATDPAAQCFLRLMARTGGTPPPGWDGSFDPLADE